MRYSKLMFITVVSVFGAQIAGAVPTAEEAAELGKSLTPFGAIKAGNKEGTIPEWTGGVCTPPSGYKPIKGLKLGGGPYVDPYAEDKVLLKITAANVAQYADKIDVGTQQLFKRFPQTFQIQVYPTRRSACFPEWMYDNTIKNVMKPRIVGGNVPSLDNAHAQIPFPIPKTGYEVMWNGQAKPEYPDTEWYQESFIETSSGTKVHNSSLHVWNKNRYWDPSLKSVPTDQPYWMLIAPTVAPAGSVGISQMRWQYLRPDLNGAPAWSYIPGQRRVRLAPDFSYDGVSITSGGVLLYDEINGFDGKMDRFDFKLVGRKELYIPYNTYTINQADMDKAMLPGHVNPDLMRWELHRVWMVEATLKPGERHVQKKKIFYFDEDSWNLIIFVGIDQADKVHHLMHFQAIQAYDKPEIRNSLNTEYDFSRGLYLNASRLLGKGVGAELYGNIKRVPPYQDNFFTPSNLTGMGVR